MNFTEVLSKRIDLIVTITCFFHASAKIGQYVFVDPRDPIWKSAMAKICRESWDELNVDWIPFCEREGILIMGESGVDIDLAEI